MRILASAKSVSVLAACCIALSASSFSQGFKTLSFDGKHGSNPGGGLVQGIDGNLYGTTVNDGAISGGTIYRITAAGKLTTIYNFCSLSNCEDGAFPNSALVLAGDGNFYGTTINGGTHDAGTAFRITPAGTFSVIYNFCNQGNCLDGGGPSGLMQASDGNFYGTAYSGGTTNNGTVFRLTPAGTLTAIHSFCVTSGCPDGDIPESALVQGIDGNLYGTTTLGGTSILGGVVFRISMTGNFEVLHDFCSSLSCADGSQPYSQLLQASDGNFYGTTYYGGTNCTFGGAGCGTIFRITPDGTLTTMFSFCPADCSAGYLPIAGLIEGSDGNLYGTTDSVEGCEPLACGAVYRMTLQGNVTAIHTFCATTGCPDGANPQAPLFQATNGAFFGAAFWGGKSTNSQCIGNGCGVLFTFSKGLAPVVMASPNFGKAGRVIKILGNDLTETSSVTFNGTPATFSVVSATYIEATVPIGATTGTIEVTVPSGALSSNAAFHVLP
jgi:uncharacterized repeat protein (TIGR03803 family)